jgi:hypothetical protein
MIRQLLESLARLLRENGERMRADMVEVAAAAPDSELNAFLASNDLWGGSGSIADCAGCPQRSDGCRKIERILVQIGNEQIRSGNVNPRTRMWVDAFTAWEKAGI